MRTWIAFVVLFGCVSPAEETPPEDDSATEDTEEVATNLFTNSSFEDWEDASSANTSPDDWIACTVEDAGSADEVDAVPDSCDAVPNSGSEGTRYVRAYSGEGIEQTVTTVAGRKYQISFDFNAVGDCFGGGSSSEWNVFVDGDLVKTTSFSSSPDWRRASVDFIAEYDQTTVCFQKVVDLDQGGLDDVSIMVVTH